MSKLHATMTRMAYVIETPLASAIAPPSSLACLRRSGIGVRQLLGHLAYLIVKETQRNVRVNVPSI